MERYAVGQGVPRSEDPRLLRGGGRYTDDVSLPGQAYANFVRSPHAHARIHTIDTAAAKAAPGVLAVLTGADYAAAGLGPLTCPTVRKARDGAPMYQPPNSPLSADRVRFVGDPVVMVVAETVALAKDAAECIAIDYEVLPAVTATARAMDTDAPAVWEDCSTNECFFQEVGDRAATEAALASADHVIRRHFVINRVSANTMEPRGCLGHYDAHEDRYTLYTAVQNPYRLRHELAETIFHLPETQFRVVTRDIGGSFGMRGGTFPEQPLVVWAAWTLCRPVKWLCERSEGLMSDYHGRDNVTDAALALDKDGRFLGLQVVTAANLGAYLSTNGVGPPINNLGTLAGTYTTPAIHVAVSGVFSHTQPTAPYRGAGRPEAAYVIERLIDEAAREMSIDPVDLRRRNTIAPEAMPFKTGLTFTYDCGLFEKNLDDTLAMAQSAGFEARRAEARGQGKLRGLGISNTIERAAAAGMERAQVRFDPTGTVTLIVGTMSQGQGHETVYKQILCERLGLEPGVIRVLEGDTDDAPVGGGSGGSRSATLGGSAIYLATDKIIAKGRRIAAHMLEAAETDIAFEGGAFAVAGTDRRVSLLEVAQTAYVPQKLSNEIEPGFDENAIYTSTGPNYPNGCHICEIEIDEDTGAAQILRYSVVDDVGTVLNPLLLKGQIQGGIAQGVGQVLMEDVVFEAGTGQLVSGSFLDYCMPRADDFPSIEVSSNPVPTKTNPLGVKGAGEAGTVGAVPAVMNAVMDALAPLGVGHLDLPVTPERIWKAIRAAKAPGTLASAIRP